MNGVRKKLILFFCILFMCSIVNFSTGSLRAATPKDENFSDADDKYGSMEVGDLTFTSDGGERIAVIGCDVIGPEAEGFKGSTILNDYDMSLTAKKFTFNSKSGTKFKLESFYALVCDNDGTSTTSINIYGYGTEIINGNAEQKLVASAENIDLSSESVNTDGVIYTRNISQLGTVIGNQYGGILQFANNWYDIDTVVIQTSDDSKPLFIALDSIDFSNLTDLSIVADDSEITEGQDATFNVNLTKTYTAPITVKYSIIPDTATADDLGTTVLIDTITIPNGYDQWPIVVQTKDDNDYEKPESFKVKILETSVGGISGEAATCTIKDNDSPPKVSLTINTNSISEENGTAKITANLSNKTYENVTVKLKLGDTPENDFIDPPTSIFIPAGCLSSDPVAITAKDDDIYSYENKPVTVDISGVAGDINGEAGGSKDEEFTPLPLTITDDETVPEVYLSIDKTSISEKGTDEAVVTATLKNKSVKDVTVKLSYAGAVKDNFTISGYTFSDDTITIPGLQKTATVKIKGIPNNKFNYDKKLTVSTSDVDVTNATLGTDKSVDLSITNIDPMPTVSVTPDKAEFNENDGKATFTVSLSQASDEEVKVDYTGIVSGQIIIPKDSLSGKIDVPITNDALDEDDEDFSITLTSADGADLGTSTATCTIIDDDDPPNIVVSSPEVIEGASGNDTKLIFDVSLSAASGKTVTVTYSTVSDTATQGSDYTAISNKTLTFTPGDKGPQQIEVTVLDDDIQEPSETVKLNLTADNANGCTATGTIKDNDKTTLSISDASVTEGPSQSIVFKVHLSKPCAESVSVNFRTKDGSAVKDDDYVYKEGTVTFDIGESGDKPVTIDIKDDELYEGTESFDVELSTESSVEMVKATGTGTINEDESTPSISVENISVDEGNSGTNVATFTVSVSPASAKDIYVDYVTLDGTAKDGKDYTAKANTLIIPAKSDSKEISVDVAGDTIYEDDETFSLSLSNPEGADIDSSKGTAVCTINDDDPAPSLTFVTSKVEVQEGDSETVQQELEVKLAAACEKTVSVNYVTEDGTATIADNDYTPLSDKLEFAPGETTKKITISVIGDKNNEPEENFYLVLKDQTGDIKAKAEIVIPKDDKAIMKVFKDKDSSEITNGKSVSFEGKENEIKFKISNMGNSELVLETPYITIKGTNKSDFSVKSEPASPIAPNDSTTFIILFNPSSPGVKTAEVSITGEDTVNSPFTFKVSGGTAPDSTSGGGTTTPEKPTIDISVGDNSLKNVAVDVKNENDTKTTTINVDETEVQKTLNEMEKTDPDKEKKVVIPVNNNSDKVVGELKASTLKAMADMDAIIEIKTENASYTLPANTVKFDEIVKELGGNPELKDIAVKVTVTKATNDKADKIKDDADKKGYELKGKPVEFEISFTNAGREVIVSSFNNYVARTVAIPEGIDPKKITTGVVCNSDGSFTHVPTAVNVIDNRYYAKINSLTNSTYALIYNPLTFKDVEKHWSKDYVNDAGSRLIVSGTGNGNFTPDRAVTRAEFAVMIVKALGLKNSQFADNFSDVGKDIPYYSYISTAYQYGIISGYTNGKFGPNDLITREQSMTMISKAMKIAGMDTTLTNTDNLNKKFSDYGDISKWAKDGAAICVNSGLFVGNRGMLNPKNNVTRAESATVIIKLLKNAHLI